MTNPLSNLWVLFLAFGAFMASFAPSARAAIDPQGRPVVEIDIRGLVRVNEQLVRNQIRQQVGDPYDAATIDQDIVRITYLGRFSKVTATVEEADGGVRLIYNLVEQPLLRAVRVEGAKKIEESELMSLVMLRPGDPVDPFLIDRGKKRIIEAYEDKGHFAAHVSVDEKKLAESQELVFQVVEGPRVRVKGVEFQGNQVFSDAVLRSRIRTKEYFPIFVKGQLDRRKLDQDAASIRTYYADRGYLDAEVGREIQQSPTLNDAVVVFIIEEGERYTVDDVRVTGATVFSAAQIEAVMGLKPGSVYSGPALQQSIDDVRLMYGDLGYIETQVRINPLFKKDEPKVELQVTLTEGTPSIVGKVDVTGNEVTKSKVILRQVRGAMPGRPFNKAGLEQTERRLNNNPLFRESHVSVLGLPEDEERDVLIEVLGQDTGSISLGAGISSDAGVIGAFDLSQSNFDITDTPDNLGELITGQAFRGAGQQFDLTVSPGNQTSTYSVAWREPYLLETDYFLGTRFRYFSRDRTDYDEQRIGGFFDIGQRFSDVWQVEMNIRVDQVDITSIDASAPTDVFAVEGPSFIAGVGFTLTRSTVDSRIAPSTGSRWSIGLERVGGDFEFTKFSTRLDKFWTVDEDFLGRKTILAFKSQLGWILEEDEAPVFERFYAGGHRSFRGFEYRGAGPRGIAANTGTESDDAVGGDFMLLMTLEYEFPLFDRAIRGVVFTDQGTVQDDVGLDEWRVSVGTGIRIKLPFFGSAPFALDFAVPIIQQDGDQEQFISFDLSLPLR